MCNLVTAVIEHDFYIVRAVYEVIEMIENDLCVDVESETVTSVSNPSDSTTLTNCIRYQETGQCKCKSYSRPPFQTRIDCSDR